MKSLLITILCFTAFNALAQTSESITEEKVSAWIKVVQDPVPQAKSATAKKQTNTSTKKSSAAKPEPAKKDTQEEFEKTNQQVNRFKKAKKQ
jgi:hypothetical protein